MAVKQVMFALHQHSSAACMCNWYPGHEQWHWAAHGCQTGDVCIAPAQLSWLHVLLPPRAWTLMLCSSWL